jgi:hypothetical protein
LDNLGGIPSGLGALVVSIITLAIVYYKSDREVAKDTVEMLESQNKSQAETIITHQRAIDDLTKRMGECERARTGLAEENIRLLRELFLRKEGHQ